MYEGERVPDVCLDYRRGSRKKFQKRNKNNTRRQGATLDVYRRLVAGSWEHTKGKESGKHREPKEAKTFFFGISTYGINNLNSGE
jgi:hypothetical protein